MIIQATDQSSGHATRDPQLGERLLSHVSAQGPREKVRSSWIWGDPVSAKSELEFIAIVINEERAATRPNTT
jgi:hypothetical protein